jgi:AdoMet-dependent heme synthase
MSSPPLRLIALEVTRQCTLSCQHCRADSHDEIYHDELSLKEIQLILDNTVSFSQPIIIITGGEPLMRADVFDIASYSASNGLRTVLATCGHLLTDNMVKKLISSGVSRISVSLDGAQAQTHDTFRGVPGAFKAVLKGLENARNGGLSFQINSTMTRLNISELHQLHDLAISLGAVAFHPFLLVPMGRGKSLRNQILSADEYEETLREIARIAEQSPLEIKPTCSPHYARIMREVSTQGTKSMDSLSSEDVRKHPMTKGCLGGQGFIFISHFGKVQLCGFLEIEAGDLRTSGYDLNSIWETSEFFQKIRNPKRYQGKCGICEFWGVCGGCRARAYALTGDFLAPEPCCGYIPKRMDKTLSP